MQDCHSQKLPATKKPTMFCYATPLLTLHLRYHQPTLTGIADMFWPYP